MQSIDTLPRRQWIAEVDYLRGFAVLAVVAIHTTSNSLIYFDRLDALVITNVAIQAFCKFAVPLFVLLSGFVLALKYERIDSVRLFYGKRMKAILAPYLVFSLLYLLLLAVRGTSLTLRHAAFAIATASSAGHLWFIAVILQLYLLYPILIAICRRLDAKGTLLFLAGAWLVQILWNVLRIVVLDSAPFQGPFLLDLVFASYLFYFVVGIAVGMQFESVRGWTSMRSRFVWLAAMAAVLLTVVISLPMIAGLATYGSFSDIPSRYFLMTVLLGPILYLSTAWVLLKVSHHLARIKGLATRVLGQFGKYSLGVYLIHYAYLLVLVPRFSHVEVTSDDWFFYPIMFVAVAALSIVSVKLLSYLPHSEWVIGVHPDNGARSKRLCGRKLHTVVTVSLVLVIGMTWWWLTVGAGRASMDKSNTTGSAAPTGVPRGGYGPSQTTRVADLWVDAASGEDGHGGLTRATAFQSIQKAADIAGPGTTVHILPGIYRETVRPALSGSAAEPVVYRAENGPGTATIRGSERSDSLTWIQLTANTIGLPPSVNPGNLYYADLSAWALNGPPRFVVQLGGSGETVTRLPLAREPDWQVTTEWKYAEFWWAADGGSTVAACDPASNQDPDCDTPSRSTTQLTDRHSDSAPAGIEPGNLTTLGNLTGATLVALDTSSGHYTYRRKIVAHDVAAGKITVDRPCEFGSGSGIPGLGWGSKYYIENHPALIDTPGEWWYDANTSRLYLWPPVAGNPATQNIEISRRDTGFQLSNRSYTTLDGLTMEFFDDSAIYQSNSGSNSSYYNTVRNATIRYANVGINLGQGADTPASITDGFTLENSEVGHIDSRAIFLNYWWPGGTANTFTHAGIVNTVIRNNEMYDLGFRTDSDNADGVQFNFADRLRFEGNRVHHIAHNGTVFGRSVIQSSKEWGISPEEIKTGQILVKDNIFEKACLLATDCGALKIWGSAPDGHVFRDLLITGNVFRNNFGWTYISEKRGRWSGGTSSDVRGMGGFGLYVDHASGIHAYRNIAYNNAFAGFSLYSLWWDGDIVYYNNVAANSLHGIRLDGDTQSSFNTQIVNNIVVNNEGYGILINHAQGGDYGNFLVDHNLYHNNGWRAYQDGGIYKPGAMGVYHPNEYYQTLAAIQANTPWEDHGVAGDPSLWDYDSADHDLFDGSSPDFHLTSTSTNGLDRGTNALPNSLIALLGAFEVTDFRRGLAYDIGRYEGGFAVLASAAVQFVSPGGVAQYVLRLDPPDLPHTVTLTVASPSPLLNIGLSSPILTAEEVVTLTVTDGHIGPIIVPTLVYTVPISGTGAGFRATTSVRLYVGGARAYLPIILRRE